jgi:hypothetical protein
VLAIPPPEGTINATFAPGDILYFTTLTSLYRVPIVFALPGDFDINGEINGADYTFWKSSFGARSGAPLHADGNGNGTVDAADYVVWRKNLSMTIGGNGEAGTAVPEASSFELVAILVVVICVCRVILLPRQQGASNKGAVVLCTD